MPLIKKEFEGFPGGAVVESLPANAGDTGSSPGLGRFRIPRSNWTREPQLLGLRVFSLYFLQSGHLENCSFWRFIIHLYQKNPAILCQCFKAEEKCFKVLTSRWCHNTGELNLRDKTIVWLRNQPLGSPGGTVVKNPPANARDTGSIPGPGKSHMPRNNEAHAPQLLSPHATITEACAPRARAPQRRAARRN